MMVLHVSCLIVTTHCVPQNFLESHIMNPILTKIVWPSHKMYGLLTKCEVKMAGYWPSRGP